MKIFTLILCLLPVFLAAQESNSGFFAFVGEKIDVKQYSPGTTNDNISLDLAFNAKYKIIENIYGNLNLDTIEFIAYDHDGIPKFSKYKTVLLYITKVQDKYFHSKYLYSAVYKTNDNKWAGLYFPIDKNSAYQINNIAYLKKMEFDPKVTIDLTEYSSAYIEQYFPEPYFKITGNKAEAIYGIYAEDIFNLNKNGILKTREH